MKTKYLLDTDIWLERLLDQERSEEVRLFLSQVTTDHIVISDFSLHSIGVILDRLKRRDLFDDFLEDVLIQGGAKLVALSSSAMKRISETIDLFGIDFDDAYQYIAAKEFAATIVSFDKDFDKTDAKRRTPSEI